MKTITTLFGMLFLSGIALASSTLNLAINEGNSYAVDGYNHYHYHYHGMSQQVFNQLHDDFSYATDSRKESLLIEEAQRHGISTSQAKHLLEEFSFDSHRLSAAKQIAGFVVDRENYWIVGEVFTFSSSKKTFLDHINYNSFNQNDANHNFNPRPRPECPSRPRPNHSYNHVDIGMSQQSFQVLNRLVVEESFDNNRKEQIITAVKHGRISAQQMTQLLREFTFDSNRLEAAKAVIPFVSDIENYWMAGESFTFSSNKDSFLKALN